MSVGIDALEQAAWRMLARRALTRHEITGKLRVLARDPEMVETVVERLVSAGYLDDEKLAREYVSLRLSRSPVGPLKLASALAARGVSRETISRVLDEQADARESGALEAARRKWRSLRDLPAAARRARVYRFLLARGFEPPAAASAAREAEREFEEENG